MSKASDNANAVTYAIRQVCGLYGCELLRMQSRVFTVPGAGGRPRPMFMGQWTDQFGKEHASGMADYLLRPRVPLVFAVPEMERVRIHDLLDDRAQALRVTIPLWVEAKSGRGELGEHQAAFKSYVESNGEAWLLIHDDLRPLMAWFEEHGVKK